MAAANSGHLLDYIGNTPLVEVKRINPHPGVRIVAKLEYFNPGGSIKDRIAKAMIEAGERSGELTPRKTIIEATSGNTGIGLALVAAGKGYRLSLAMSESASTERRRILAALGADIMLTPGRLGTDGAIEEVYRLARERPDQYFLPDQYNNPANIDAHYHGTGREIWEQTNGRVDVLVATIGTTGTLMGCAKRLKEMNAAIRAIGVEPYLGHKIQGLKNLKESYVPGIFDRSLPDELVNIDDEDAFEMTRRLAREEGLFVGMSSGAAMHVAMETAKKMNQGLVVAVLPDGGERYLSTPLFVPREKTSLKFHNVLTKQKDDFISLKPGRVSMYSCGPALHSTKPVAAYRHFVTADLLKRYLTQRGFDVHQVVNLVDLDDRTIAASAAAKTDLQELTQRQFESFLRDCDRLNIRRADEYPRAADHVPDMIQLGRRLAEKGAAYEKLRSLYFDIGRYRDYGRLSGADLSKIRLGKTVDLDLYEKENPRDFALFKRSNLADLKRGLYYATEWGSVRPGWHIQCAAISQKYLGDVYDVHTGGREHNFPHFENVHAIGAAAHGHSPARYWIHSELVLVDGRKMSRSADNAPSLDELIDRGHRPETIRFWLLATHYRKPLPFSTEGLEAAGRTVARINEFAARLNDTPAGGGVRDMDQQVYDLRQGFKDGLDDDLNVAAALAALFQFIRTVNPLLDQGRLSASDLAAARTELQRVNEVLGVIDLESDGLSTDQAAMIAERERARAAKDFGAADRLRDRLLAEGIHVIDTKKGTRWKRIDSES